MIAFWLVVLAIMMPLVGVVLALALLAVQRGRSASACVRLGMAGCCVASVSLMCLLSGAFGPSSATASVPLWTWLDLSGPRPLHIVWSWRADALAAGWVAVLSSLAWVTLSSTRRAGSDRPTAEFVVTAGLLHLSAVAFVFATDLVQMLLCYEVIFPTTILMVGGSSTKPEIDSSIQRLIRTSLAMDAFVIVASSVMGQMCGTYVLDEILSAEGLSRLGEQIPALPGFVGCLLVLGVLGRSGLFPCFGWHHGASAWDNRAWLMVYAVGYVPSAIWLLLRFRPLLEASERTLELLGGLATLGAVLGAFVAWGQDEPRRAWAFLVTAQVGVVFAMLASGLMDAETLRAWRLGPTEVMPQPANVARVLIGQFAVIVGGLTLWRATRASRRPPTRTASWESLVRLSRERLYVDEVARFVFSAPMHAAVHLARFVDRSLSEVVWPALSFRFPGWLAQQAEALEMRRVEFAVATLLLGTATLLLTLVLVT